MFRLTHVPFEKKFNVYTDLDTLDTKEWEDTMRLNEPGWGSRYEYEAELIRGAIEDIKPKTILEIGSGPGTLSQLVQKNINIEYHLVDKPFAEKYFKEHQFKGKFFIKDISIDLNIEGLLPKYDMIICNDVLEHLLAPTNIIKKMYHMMNDNSIIILSVPNWRMGHQFLYRGLWDYDNVLYLLYIHGLQVDDVYPSPLQTPPYPKLDSESCLPNELLTSWNFYMVVRKRKL